MSAKRPPIDLMALTAEQATPMPEAVQRSAPATSTVVPMTQPKAARKPLQAGEGRMAAVVTSSIEKVRTENLEALAFKVPPSFRVRFRRRAADADLKLNELLFQAFEAWEEKQGFKK